MSPYNIIQAIASEAKERKDRGESDAYELEIVLGSGRIILCAPLPSNSYFLRITAKRWRATTGSPPSVEQRISYLSYEAIEQVTPLWL